MRAIEFGDQSVGSFGGKREQAVGYEAITDAAGVDSLAREMHAAADAASRVTAATRCGAAFLKPGV